MEKKVMSVAYMPQTNSTRVYYEDGTFDAYPGNCVAEKSGLQDTENVQSYETQEEAAAAAATFSPSPEGNPTPEGDNTPQATDETPRVATTTDDIPVPDPTLHSTVNSDSPSANQST